MKKLLFVLLFCGAYLASVAQAITVTAGTLSFCAGNSVTLTVNPTTGITNYQWIRDGVNVSGGNSASLVTSASGNYTVLLRRTAPLTDTTIGPTTVTNNPIPATPTFTAPAAQCANVPYSFQVNTPLASTSYLWNFGDGATTTGNPVSHTFTATGSGSQSFNVWVKARSAAGCISDSFRLPVTVNQIPRPSLTDQNSFSPFNNCGNNTGSPSYDITVLNNTANPSTISGYVLNWGDGSGNVNLTNAGFPLSHTYTSYGEFNLTLTATNSTNGCSNTFSQRVINQLNPGVGIQGPPGGSTQKCDSAGFWFKLTNYINNTPGTVYTWDFGDGSPTIRWTTPVLVDSIFHLFTKSSCELPGREFIVTVTASNACDDTRASINNIKIFKKPQAIFDVVSSPSCINTPVNFNNISITAFNGPNCNTITGWQWDFGDPSSGAANTSTDMSPSHVYANPGVYTVKLFASGSCGIDSTTRQVCITRAPAPAFTLDTLAGCFPFVVRATNTTNIFNSCQNPTYRWDVTYAPGFCGNSQRFAFVNGTSDTSANPQIRFDSAGTYTLIQRVTNACGTFTSSQNIVAKRVPIANIQLPAYSCGVVNIIPAVNVTSCGTGTLGYNWVFTDATPGNASTANPGSINFTTLGAHPISVAVTNECGTTTAFDTVTVTVAPNVIVPGADTVCGGTIAGTYNFTSTIGTPIYQWTNSNPAIGLPATGTGNIAAFVPTNTGTAPITATIIVTPRVSSCIGPSDTFSITVLPEPAIPTVTTPVVYCQNEPPVPLAATGTGANLLTWYTTPALTGGTTITPVPPTITPGVTNWYVTQTNSFGCRSKSNTITVRVNPGIAGNTIGPNQTICAATAADILFSGSLSGGTGFYDFVWQQSTDGGTVWSNIPGATNGSYSPGVLNAGVQYRRLVFSLPCRDTSNVVTITVQSALTNFNISASQIICQGLSPASFAGELPVGGGGSPTFIWQQSTDNINWADIGGATAQNYQSPILNATTSFRRITRTADCSAVSNVITVTVNPTPNAALTALQTDICTYETGVVRFDALVGTPPYQTVIVVTRPDASTDTIRTTVTSNLPFNITVIPASSQPGNYTVQLFSLSDGNGCGRSSNLPGVAFVVKPLPVLVLSSPPTICNGVSATLTASGASSYNWSPNQFINTTVGTNVIVTPNTTTLYNVRGTLNGCFKDSGILVTVIPGAVAANAGPNQALCNLSIATLAGNTPSANAAGAWSQTGGPAISFADNTLNNTALSGLQPGNTYTFRWTITGQPPCPPTNDDVVIDVLTPVVNRIAKDSTICNGQSLQLLTTTLSGGSSTAIDSAYTFVWESTPAGQSNWQAVPGATSEFLLATPSVSTCYRRRVRTNGLCESISNEICITVNPNIANNTIGSNQQVCVNTAVANLQGSTPAGGDGNFVYTWQTSTNQTSWTTVGNALNYPPPVYTAAGTHFFRRLVASGNCTDISNIVTLQIRPNAKALFTANPLINCAPFNLATAITVTHLPDSNGTYNWYANNQLFGTNSTGVFPPYSITNPGDTVPIKLVTLSPFGCQPDSTTQTFITFTTAVARFTKDATRGCGPLLVNFTNTSNLISPAIEFFWDFGNGITSTLAQPGEVSFATSPFFNDTTYQVVLKAYNGCDTTIWRDSITVRSNPSARFGVSTTFGCSPFPITVTNTSLGGPSTYYWDFGNGHKDTTFALGTINYTYNIGNVVDTFPIQLIAVNECGSDTQIINVRIAPNVIRPQIIINASDQFGCAPHAVSFTNATTGATSFTWNFGDGSAPLITNTSQSTIVHTYNTAGVFTVKIDLTNGCSDTTVFTTATVYAKPIAAFTTNAGVYCLGDTVRTSNTSANATNYLWFWGDGTTATSDNPVHVFTVAGDYTIRLQADRSNSFGPVCFDTAARNITILVKPNAAIQSNIAAVNCVPFTYTASVPAVTSESITWQIGDTAVSATPIVLNGSAISYTFTKPGTFTIKSVSENFLGCRDSAFQTFTVRGTPKAGFTPLITTVCKTDTTVLHTNTSLPGDNGPLTYRWLIDGSFVTNNGNLTYNYFVPGASSLPRQFTTWLVATNVVGCTDTAKGSLTMNPNTRARFSVENATACLPFNATIIDNSEAATLYKWYVNDTLISNAPTPVIGINRPNTLYRLRLIAANDFNCKPDTFELSFTTRQMPQANFGVNDTLGCTSVLNVATTNRSLFASQYVWNWGDASPTSTLVSPTHLYNIRGQYLISLVAGDGTCTDTALQYVRVSQKPVVDFSLSNTLTCDTARVQLTNLTTGAASYLWSFSDGTTSTLVEPFKNFAPSLTPYTIRLVANDGLGCKDSATKANVLTAKVPPPADFFISPTPVITIPNYTFSFNNLTPNSNRYFYQWNLGDGNNRNTRDVPNYKYADTGSYPVRLIVLDTSTNCADTVIKIARIDGFPGWLMVPNAICPGCLQTNLQQFIPKGQGLASYRLQIFTTWGELIFQTTEIDANGAPLKGWDGRFKGQPVQQDVYVWRIDARFKNGTQWQGMIYPGEAEYKKTGTITVVR
jgi:large repetitive protein